MANLEVRLVQTKADEKAFIDLPYQLYKDDPNWVPPFRAETKENLNKNKNPFFEHGEISPYIALKDGKVVGRIAAIVNGNHNRHFKDNNGFFGFFEAIDDLDVFKVLIDTAIEELQKKDKDYIVGPTSPSLHDVSAFLTKGFDMPPLVMMAYNPSYYPENFYKLGFEKAKGMYAYYLKTEDSEINEKMLGVEDKLASRGIKMRNINMKDFSNEAQTIFKLYTDAWANNWGYVPLTQHEFDHIAANLKMIIDPRFAYIVEKDGDPIAFSIALPNINEILIDNRNGRLRPDIILKLLMNKKKVKSVRIMLLGVKQKYQKFGLGAVMYAKYMRTAEEINLHGGEMSWVLEDNIEMTRAAEFMKGELYKKYEMLGKKI